MSVENNKSRHIIVLLILCVVLVVLGYATYRIVMHTRYQKSDVSTKLFDETDHPYTSLQGEVVTLTSYAGKNIYVNNWASWSPLSQQELIDLNEVAGEFKDKNIVFIALNRKETKDQAQRYMASLPKLPNLNFIIDTDDNFYGNVDGYAMPETVIFTTDGTTAYHDRTPLTKDEMRNRITTIIGG